MDLTNFSQETKQQAKAYDFIGEKYEEVFGNNATQIAAVEWLIEHLSKEASVLDVGCGTGVPTAKMLSEAGFKVQGIDVSPVMLKIATRKAPLAKFQLMDMERIDLFPEKVDAIVAFFSLLGLRRSAIIKTINKITKILHDRGYFLLSMVEGDVDYVEQHFLDTTLRFSAYRKEELANILEAANFKILQVKTLDFIPKGNAPPEKQLYFFCQLEEK